MRQVLIIYALLGILGLVACERDVTRRDKSKRYDVICIDGFEFYERWAGDKGYAANKLDKEGKPVPCKKL